MKKEIKNFLSHIVGSFFKFPSIVTPSSWWSTMTTPGRTQSVSNLILGSVRFPHRTMSVLKVEGMTSQHRHLQGTGTCPIALAEQLVVEAHLPWLPLPRGCSARKWWNASSRRHFYWSDIKVMNEDNSEFRIENSEETLDSWISNEIVKCLKTYFELPKPPVTHQTNSF